MQIQWDPKIGPAAIIGFLGSLSVLVTIGIFWGTTVTRLDNVIDNNRETNRKVQRMENVQRIQEEKASKQAIEISAMQSTLQFLVPTIQRIEAAISHAPPKP